MAGPTLTEEQLIGGRYRILREIAAGGMGTVYEARHALSEKIVALKVLHPHIARDAASHQRFLREVRVPAQIGHDGIVDVYDADIDQKNGTVFFAMELLDGETLRQRLTRGHVPLGELLDVFGQLLDALAAAHAKGIVHRDLKPENVFLVRRKTGGVQVKICDFGIVRDIGQESEKVTQVGTAMGTPEYMSPEQATNARDVTAATDVWAVGVMLYETLAGRTPFTGSSPTAIVVEMLTRPHQPMHSIAPGVPRALADLVDRCLSKDPSERPPDAGALRVELERAGRSAIVPPTSAFDLSSVTGSTNVGQPAAPTRPGPSATGPGSLDHAQTTPETSTSQMSAPHVSAPYGAAPAMSATPVSTPHGSAPAVSTPGFGGPPPASAPSSAAHGPSFATKPKRGLGWGPLVIGLVLVAGLVVIGGLGLLYGIGAFGAGSGQLRVQTTIANGELFVDGTSRGPLTPGRVLELPTGQHIVEARVSGASLVTQNVSVSSGRMVDVTLEVPVQRFAGTLGPGDRQLNSGEYIDDYNFEWPANVNVHIEMTSASFNTYLIVWHNDRPQQDVDDADGTNAVVDFTTGAAGSIHVGATSARPGETGPYEIVVRPPP